MNLFKSLYSLRLLGGGSHNSIVDVATSNTQFSQLVKFVSQAGLVDTLQGQGPYTVFAPVDEAFEKLPPAVVEKYEDPEWSAHLNALLRYHVIGNAITSDVLEQGSQLETLEGNAVDVSLDPIMINNASVVEPFDVVADNGIVHAIDEVLLPPSATDSIVDLASANEETFSVLLELVQLAGLSNVLTGEGPYTVFAPTNEAFEKLSTETIEDLKQDTDALRAVLMYHVVPGIYLSTELDEESKLSTLQGSELEASAEPMINNIANVVEADLLASNGVVHAVNSVLLPPAATLLTMSTPPSEDETFMTVSTPESSDGEDEALVPSVKGMPQEYSTGPDLGSLGGSFTKIKKLLASTGIVESLEANSTYTVFAPTNQAMKELPKDVVDKYMGEEWSAHLESLLLYHIVGGNAFYSSDLADGMELETLEGSSVMVTISGDPPVVMIDDAEVMEPFDVNISNVVVHAIDEVLLPPSATDSIVDIAQDNSDTFSTLLSLLDIAELDDVLDDDASGPFTVLAPTNDAFAQLSEDDVEALKNDKTALAEVLTYHVVSGVILSSELLEGPVETLQGSAINVTLDPIMFNGAGVVVADILASNGVIHAIDTVLIPSTPEEEQEAEEEDAGLMPSVKNMPGQTSAGSELGSLGGNFTKIIKLLTSTGIANSLEATSHYTVFAPTNEAIMELPQDVVEKYMDEEWGAHLQSLLLYHIVGGEAIYSGDLEDGMELETLEGSNLTVTISGDAPVVMIDDSEVVEPYDVNISNIVVHAIDEVLLPPSAEDTIFDIAEDNNNAFSTLLSLLDLAGLDDVLDDDAEGPFTVLAPTNDAFAKLPNSTVNALTSDITALSEVLTYHVIPGIVLSSELLEGQAETLQGSVVNITLDPIMFNDAVVMDADILASNGVIHVIDTVLIPPPSDAVPVVDERDGAP